MGGRKPTDREVGLVTTRMDKAVRTQPSSFEQKIEMIMLYIREEALQERIPISKVPCPNDKTWDLLSASRHPRLPSDAQMRMFASGHEAMQKVISKVGIRRAYFLVAKRKLVGPAR